MFHALRSTNMSIAKRILLLGILTAVVAQTPRLHAEDRDITFWHVGVHEEMLLLDRVAEQFYAETGIRVHTQPIPWGSFATKYLTAMAAGNPPDVGTTSLTGGLDYGKVGGVIDLQQQFPEAIARLKKLIFPNMWRSSYFNDHLFSVPFNANALIGFYRKDVFADLNIQPPQTWSELQTVLDSLIANDYLYGFIWTRNTSWGLGTYIWPFGETAYADNGTRINWTSPGFVKGYTFAQNLWNSYNLYIEKPVEVFSIPDKRKCVPLFFDYDMRYLEIMIRAPHLREKFGIFPFPQADDGVPATIMGGRSLVIFRQGKHHDAAMQWIEYILSKKSQFLQHKTFATLGERSQLALSINREFWDEDLELLPGDQEVFHEIFKRCKTDFVYPWYKESDRILEQTFYKIQRRVNQYFKEIADREGDSIHDVKKAFAAGKMPEARVAYQRMLTALCASTLTEAAMPAQTRLDEERYDYERYYGGRLHQIIESPDRRDILDDAKWTGALLLLCCLAAIVFVPRLRKHIHGYLYIMPPLAAAFIFILVPIIVSFYLSFTKYNPVIPLNQATWVGWENYIHIFQDGALWKSLGRSLYFSILVLPAQLFIALILAACLDKNLVPDRLYKFIYFSPLVTSVVSVSLIWYALYASTHYGWINSLLLAAGLTRDPLEFLNNSGLFLNSVIVMSVWQGLAFTILILLAGLKNVSASLYEAAAMDGAGPFRQFFNISLPQLRPQLTFLVIIGTIGTVQVFEQIYMFGMGSGGEAESRFGPDDSGLTIVPYIYRQGFEYFKMGEASAIAYILFVLLLALTFLNMKLLTTESNG